MRRDSEVLYSFVVSFPYVNVRLDLNITSCNPSVGQWVTIASATN